MQFQVGLQIFSFASGTIMPPELAFADGWLYCDYDGCSARFKSYRGRTYHVRSKHTIGNTIQDTVRVPSPTHDLPPPPIIIPDAENLSDGAVYPSDDSESTTSDEEPFEMGPDLPAHPVPPADSANRTYHPYLMGTPCDLDGNPLPPGVPPIPKQAPKDNDWAPFAHRQQFEIADLVFRKVEMSAGSIDELFSIWGLPAHDPLDALDCHVPFKDHNDMYDGIDSSTLGDAPWQCFQVSGDAGPDDPRQWKQKIYDVWYRDPDVVLQNMLDNPDFDGEFDYSPYVELDDQGQRRWHNFMSANFAWRHSTMIYEENKDQNRGAMYCPIILGSDKTTVSVATGQVEYHPLYMSIGNIHGSTRRAHRQGVIPIAFLAIPKADRRYDNDAEFRKFKRQLYHSSISTIFSSIREYMGTPIIRRCPDGHLRRVIFDFGSFIGDYPEQVMLAGIVQKWCARCSALCTDLDNPVFSARREQGYTNTLIATFDPGILWDEFGIDNDIIPFTNDFPRADIHEILTPDLLHQIIKGTFKDHLVAWVAQYLELEHGPTEAEKIMDEIDHRIAATPSFPGLRRFPDGRRFKQWTGDDSKALMKVYLPALAGFIPPEMMRALRSFLDFCYLVQRPSFTPATLDAVQKALQSFHQAREVFRELGVRPGGFSLPRQHSLIHYVHLIQEFGAPNGLCSSITESRHITAVKKPWRRSSRWNALGQMLTTNQRLDKLAAMRTDFESRGMIPLSHDAIPKPKPRDDLDEDGCAPTDDLVQGNVSLARTRIRTYPRDITLLGQYTNLPELHDLTRQFLYDHLYPNAHYCANDIPVADCPEIYSKVSVFHSAVATFFAPSDLSGIHGMRRERIRSTPDWRGGGERRDCALVVENQESASVPTLFVLWFT
ncbi:hypothetical protein EYR36_000188 [Pleurotus pulmonarius]|nr:hypothetical protein EYR36_000188 [Pleurotus pulmonarius]